MNEFAITIDGQHVTVKGKMSIFEAATKAGIYIPSLCYHPDLPASEECGLCLVRAEGKSDFVISCTAPAAGNMVVYTNTPELRQKQREVLKKILSEHPSACLTCWRKERCQPFDICLRNVAVTERCVTCSKNGRCELQKAVDFIGLDEMPFPYTPKGLPVERENPFIVRDNNLCILCGRGIRVDQEILGFEAIAFNLRGAQTYIGGAFGKPLIESGCTFCGSCGGGLSGGGPVD